MHLAGLRISDMENTPFAQVREFIRRQRAAGRYKAATARNLESACVKLESLLEPPNDNLQFVEKHLGDLVERYGNLHQSVGRGSLDSYRQRIAKAIADYTAHRTDPQWRPDARRARKVESPKPRPVGKTPAQPADVPVSTSVSAMTHRLPLRGNFDVEITLPRDFTAQEAKRVSAWITVLAAEPAGAEQ
jgi:hypothetical protein